MSHEFPSRPWEKIATDIFTLDGKDYLVTIDYYWQQLLGSRQIAPRSLLTLQEHGTSSPGHSKSNGKAESEVKTAKRILRKLIKAGTDPNLAILDYRNTPTQGMTSSPAQWLMSRRTKTLLPTTQSLLLPKNIHLENEKRELWWRQQVQAEYYYRTAKDLPSLSEGDVIGMKPFKLGNKSCPKAQVTARLDERSYTVETEHGAVYHRNWQHLTKTSEPPNQQTSQSNLQTQASLPAQVKSLQPLRPTRAVWSLNSPPCLQWPTHWSKAKSETTARQKEPDIP